MKFTDKESQDFKAMVQSMIDLVEFTSNADLRVLTILGNTAYDEANLFTKVNLAMDNLVASVEKFADNIEN